MKSKLGTTLIIILLFIGIGGMIYLNYQLFNPSTPSDSDLVFEDQKPGDDNSIDETPSATEVVEKIAQVLYQNDFASSAALQDFTIVDTGDKDKPSKWEVKSGTLVQSSNIWGGTFGQPVMGKSFLGTMAIVKGKTFQDFDFTVTLKGADDDGMGVVFRADSNNFYRLLVVQDTKNGGPFAMLDKQVYKDGKKEFTALKKADWKYEINTPYTFRIQAKGASLTGSINGNQLFAVNDTTFTSGSIGIYSYGEQGLTISDLVVKEILGGTTSSTSSTNSSSTTSNIISNDTTDTSSSSTKVVGTIKSVDDGGMITITDSTSNKDRFVQIISTTTLHQNTATGVKASLSDLKAGKTIEVKGAVYTPVLANETASEIFIGERIIVK